MYFQQLRINPAPTVVECCNDLIIKELRYLFIYIPHSPDIRKHLMRHCDIATLIIKWRVGNRFASQCRSVA